ncbi:MAG: hypothetical protein QW526_02840 [Candidatus Jordarchaeales archaeon]
MKVKPACDSASTAVREPAGKPNAGATAPAIACGDIPVPIPNTDPWRPACAFLLVFQGNFNTGYLSFFFCEVFVGVVYMTKPRLYIDESSPPISDNLYEKIAAHRKLYRKLVFSGKAVKRLRGILPSSELVRMLRGGGGKLRRFDIMIELYCDVETESRVKSLYDEVCSTYPPQKSSISLASEGEEPAPLRLGLSWEDVSFDAWALIERFYSVIEEPFYVNFEFEDDEKVVSAVNLSVPFDEERRQFYLVELVTPFRVKYPSGEERLLGKLSSLVEEVTSNPNVTPELFVIGRGGMWKPLITVGWSFNDGRLLVKVPEWNGKGGIEFILDPINGKVQLIKGDLKVEKDDKLGNVSLDAVQFFELGGDELSS